MLGDFHAGTAKAVWALLSLYHRSPCCCTSFPLHIEGGYSCRPTVLLVSLSPENQADQGPRHHMIPIIVARQRQLVTRHEYSIIHGPSKVLKAVDVSKVHPQICISQHVALLFLTSIPLHALAQCYLKNLICHHALHIEIVCLQLLEDKEEFVKCIHKYVQAVACVQYVQGCACLPLEGQGVEVHCLLIHMIPQVLIVPAELATKVPMEDHVKSENKSQQT